MLTLEHNRLVIFNWRYVSHMITAWVVSHAAQYSQ